MMPLLVAAGVLLFVALGIGGWAVGLYNALIALRYQVDQTWANIDVLLKQRRDELTKAIDTVKGLKNFEQETLRQVTEARGRASATLGAGNVAAASAESAAIRGFFAVAEAYPELKSDQGFLKLQANISSLEGQIADRREVYNDAVNTFNTRIAQFPDSVFASLLGYARREYFRVAEADKEDVKVQF
jgi:LemA protein